MQPGKLRHPIAIQQPSAAVDVAGQDAATWSTYLAKAYAAVKQVAGDETEERGRSAAQRRYEIKVRFVTGFTTAMRIVTTIDGTTRTLNVQSINADVTDARFMIVTATEELNG